jgi:hypothetical protein
MRAEWAADGTDVTGVGPARTADPVS